MNTKHLPETLRPLFWDYDFEGLDWPAGRDLVIARVLQHGGEEAIRWLRGEVKDAELGAWIRARQGRGLDPRRLRFWQLILDLPEAEVSGWIDALRALPAGGMFP